MMAMRGVLTKLYLRYAAHINTALRPCGLVLMAEFEGAPPARPCTVQRIFIQRRSVVGLWD